MGQELKIGIIGLDSSHAVEFAKLWHDRTHPFHVPGARITAAYPGGSADWPLSYQRVKGFTAQLAEQFGVKEVTGIDALVAEVDAVMILSIDGRVHPAQFAAVVAAGKPVFIDKPMALNPEDVVRMQVMADAAGTRFWSASSWRYAQGLDTARRALGGACERVTVGGPWPVFPGLQGWAFYGMHHIELLYAALGTGCQSVTCIRTGPTETIMSTWADDRTGVIMAEHDQQDEFWARLSRGEQTVRMEVTDTLAERYAALLQRVVAFFNGAEAPVSPGETKEIIAFLAAAWRSRRLRGEAVELAGMSK